MEKFDWIKPIAGKTFLVLKIIGLWPEKTDVYVLNLYTLWTFFSITAFIFAHPFFQFCKVFFILNDVDDLVSLIYITLAEVLTTIKACLVIKNVKILKKLIRILQSEFFQPRNQRQVELVESYLQFWKNYIDVFWVMAALTVFFVSSYPIFDASYKEYKLPFMAWYPFDAQVSPNYEFAYLHQILGVSLCGCAAVSIDTLVFVFYIYMKTQLDILCDELRHFCDEPEQIRRRLLHCVNHHRTILNFAEDFAEFANWIILGQFFISAISIGLTMFQLTTVKPLSTEFFSLLIFLIAVTTEMFIYCWFGNEVQLKSTDVPNAIFESNWLETSSEIKKYIIFFIQRNQKPLKISALHLFCLSVETFIKILRASWSYFALLNSIKK